MRPIITFDLLQGETLPIPIQDANGKLFVKEKARVSIL